MAKMKWYGDEVERRIERELQRRLDLIALKWVQIAKQKLSSTGVVSPRGGYPYKQSGQLRRNMAWDNDRKLVNRVGTNVEYAKYLEFKYNRPFMALTNMRIIPTIKSVMGRKI